MKTKVQVKDLQVGDELSLGTTVLGNSLSTTKGKNAVCVKYLGGTIKTQLWGRSTTVTVTNR